MTLFVLNFRLIALILIPLIAALFSWLGVRLLLRSLFRNVIPAQLPMLSENIAREAGRIFANSNLAEKAKDPAIVKSLMPGIESHIDGFLQQRLKEKIPVLAMFLSDQILQTIRQSLVDEIEMLLPNVIGQFAGRLEQELNIEGMVRKRLSALTPEDLERRIRQSLNGPIGKLQLGAAFWGLLTGLVQVVLVLAMLAS